MIIRLDELAKIKGSIEPFACIVDTNVLFAASTPSDSYNEWADQVFRVLHANKISIFTNINIRSEFIDLSRRVLILEGLMDFYKVTQGNLRPEIEHKLKSVKSRIREAVEENRSFKFSDAEIKKWREILSCTSMPDGTNGWSAFCREFFHPFLVTVWDDVISELGIQFLGTRAIESKDYFHNDPKWPDMVDIVGRTGIGTSDAMIMNLFLQSKLPLIITADSDVRDAVASMMPKNKYVLAPDR